MLDIDNIENLHLQIVKFINKIPSYSNVKKAFIINLPCILVDIIDLCNISEKEWEEKTWIIDRVVNGPERNFYKENSRLILKKFFYFKNTKKIYIPIFERKRKNIDQIVFDIPNVVNYQSLHSKKLENHYISSINSIFCGKFDEKAVNQAINSLINDFIVYLSKLEFINKFFTAYKSRLIKFKSKLILSTKAAHFRLIQCKKYLPRNAIELYLPTLCSPFNRIIALAGIDYGSKIISFDHGTGVAFPSSNISINLELDLSCEYITFSDLFKEIISNNICNELRCTNKKIPLVISPTIDSKPKIKDKNIKEITFSNFKNILYLPSVISNKSHIHPLLKSSEYLQLQLNIIRNLKSVGNYSLFLREHPETEVNLPKVLLNELEINVVEERIEKLNKKFIFLIDYLQTTCLRFAISNNIPVLAIVVNKNLINKKIFTELSSLPNFEYLIPKVHSGNYIIENSQVLSLIQNLKKNFSPNYVNSIFGNYLKI